MRIITQHSVLGFFAGAIVSPIVIVLGLYVYIQSTLPGGGQPRMAVFETGSRTEVSLDWEAQTLDGTRFNMDEEYGDEILFLNFWATWCPPCKAEMPSIEKLYQQFKGKIRFACISKEAIDEIRMFKSEQGYTFPMYHIPGEPPGDLNIRSIPATFIISSEGRLALKHVGGADWAHESVVGFLRDLLAEANASAEAGKAP